MPPTTRSGEQRMTDPVAETVRKHMEKVLARISALKRTGPAEQQGPSSGPV
jgi:hypothetical protein